MTEVPSEISNAAANGFCQLNEGEDNTWANDECEKTALAHSQTVETWLADSGGNVNARTDGMTLLFLASMVGNVPLVSSLLSRGAGVDEVMSVGPGEGETALGSAAKKGCVEVVRLLLGAKANVDLANPPGSQNTPLNMARACDHEKIVAALEEEKTT